jgi:hypothetical protein
MAYMVMQQYTTAVKAAYAGRPDVRELLHVAGEVRAWLEALEIPGELLGPMVEPVAAVEEGLRELVAARRQG